MDGERTNVENDKFIRLLKLNLFILSLKFETFIYFNIKFNSIIVVDKCYSTIRGGATNPFPFLLGFFMFRHIILYIF